MLLKKQITISLVAGVTLLIFCFGSIASDQVSKDVLNSISTPEKVKTSIGTLEFFDGAPQSSPTQDEPEIVS